MEERTGVCYSIEYLILVFIFVCKLPKHIQEVIATFGISSCPYHELG